MKVAVTGAGGRMGQETVRWILKQQDMELVGAIEKGHLPGTDIGKVVSGEECGIIVSHDLRSMLQKEKPECLVDFTNGSEAPSNVLVAISHGVPSVVGTTGIKESDMEEMKRNAESSGIPVLVAPNFSMGAVLMMQFALMASRYFHHAEILELHHDRKVDAPSGTALRTAQMMADSGHEFFPCRASDEKLQGVRGGEHRGIAIHSVRLPGLLAHQEVIFGGEGEVLTIRHDSMARSSFMPGVMLAIRRIRTLSGLTVGLEHLLELSG
ncbi:MAG: 4-hydroxy-tetrahydrodipicolinate reductase [Candidatus Eremiobacteraeota bacterium]|nr:4-hydroxy-tetrahydrodipicolinate reductase [Candidatus Eremiobacteraeota bacterium]